MAACIVCNQQVFPADLQDAGGMAKLCYRLGNVLGEAVPEGSVMCVTCKYDLGQIEMYYSLLTVFKKRYSETAKIRLKQIQSDETQPNLLHQTTECSSENFQYLLGTADSSENGGFNFTLQSTMEEGNGGSNIPTEVGSIEVKVEFPVVESPAMERASTDLANIPETKVENTDPIEFPMLSQVEAPRKRGRPRKNIQPTAVTASPKKRGRPRKNVQANTNSRLVNKPGRPKSSAQSTSATTSKKRGRPRKSERADNSQAKSSAESQTRDLGIEDPELKTSVEGEAEEAKFVQMKVEVPEPDHSLTVSSKTVDDVTKAVRKTVPCKPRKDQDPEYDPGTRKTRVRKSRERVKKDKPQPPFTCSVCSKVFDDKYKYNIHVKTHSDERPHVCTECGKAFKDSGGLRGHMRTHTAEKTHECPVCRRTFLLKKTMERHQLVHTDVKPYPCNQCEQRFKSADRLKYHFKLAHVQGRKFLCSICGMALYTANTLRIHMNTHTSEKPFQCPTCGKGYVTKQALNTHQTSHTEQGRIRHLCPICGKSFSNKSYLGPHIRQHKGESTHICTICNKSCVTGHAYRRHMLIHNENKPHQCTECGKRFRVISNLNQHMISHSVERPFVCACGKAFNRKYKLQRHMQTKIHQEHVARTSRKGTDGPPNRARTAPKMLNAPRETPAQSAAAAQRAEDALVAHPGPDGLSMGVPVPVTIAPESSAPALYTDVAATLGAPVDIQTQHEQFNTVNDEGETAPMYLVMYEEEEIIEHNP